MSATELADYLFSGPESHAIGFTFQAMEYAEDEIDAAEERHPEAAARLNAAFLVCKPRAEMFAGKAEHTVRAHMREILDRVAAGDDVGPGTATEMCLALGHISMAAPLRARHQKAYEIAFLDAFGEKQATALLGAEVVRRARLDREQDIIRDVLDEVRNATADDERAKAWRSRAGEVERGPQTTLGV